MGEHLGGVTLKIISQDKWIKVDGLPHLSPKVRYVTCNEQAHQYTSNIRAVKWRVSDVMCDERPYGGQPLNGKSIAIMRYAGIGDLLISTALVHYLRVMYPQAEIHVYTMVEPRGSGSESVYTGHADLSIGAPMPLPMTLDAVKQYDYHCFIDGTLEANMEPDQGNCYDDMFARYGMKDVPDRYKRPYITMLPSDDRYAEQSGIDLTGRHFLYCAHSSCAVRNYPYDLGKQVIEGLLKEYTDARVFVLTQDPSFVKPDDERCIVLGKLPEWRSMIPFIRTSSCVIGPDSGASHVTAMFEDVPYVGLWAAFPPHARVTHYKNHHVLSGASSCRNAPCCVHAMNNQLPESKCKECKHWSDGTKSCPAMREITPKQVIDKVKSLV